MSIVRESSGILSDIESWGEEDDDGLRCFSPVSDTDNASASDYFSLIDEQVDVEQRVPHLSLDEYDDSAPSEDCERSENAEVLSRKKRRKKKTRTRRSETTTPRRADRNPSGSAILLEATRRVSRERLHENGHLIPVDERITLRQLASPAPPDDVSTSSSNCSDPSLPMVRSQPSSPRESSGPPSERIDRRRAFQLLPAGHTASLSSFPRVRAKRRVSDEEKDLALRFSDLTSCKITLAMRSMSQTCAFYEEFHSCENVSFVRENRWTKVQERHCSVVFCSSGITNGWAAQSASVKAAVRQGKQLKSQILSELMEEGGELVPGQSVLIRCSACEYVLFTCLAYSPMSCTVESYYAAMRSAFRCVQKHNRRLAETSRSVMDDPSFAISSITVAEFPTFELPLAPVAIASALGAISVIEERGLTEVRMRSLELCLKKPQRTLEQVMTRHARNGTLAERGLASVEEAEVLLQLFFHSNMSTAQHAMTGFAELVRTAGVKERRLPLALKRQQLLAVLARRPDAFQMFLKAAQEKRVCVLNVIQETDVEFESQIGVGATATVHQGSWDGYDVAIKRYFEGYDEKEFMREAFLMSILSHPHLIRLIGCSKPTLPEPFLVMERAVYGSLSRLIHSSEAISMKRLLLFATQATRAVQHLHSLGLIHRDLKTDNLLLCENFIVKLTDYGTMKAFRGATSMTGNVGTTFWMAPEVFEGSCYTDKADIYSLGMLFYELFVRKVPFGDQPQFSVPVMVVRGKRPSIPSSVPKAVHKLIESMWAAKASRRPTTDKILSTLHHLMQELREAAASSTS